MSRPLPLHPRIANHVQARRHLVDGKELVVLTDGRSPTTRVISPEQWDMLACADGTRTFDGILLAAAGNRVYTRASAFHDLLSEMHDAGLLDEGLESLAMLRPTSTAATPESRPVAVLPGFSFTCEGLGHCCAVYPTISFTELETARARSLRPEVLQGGSRAWQVFTPFGGVRDNKTLAVTFVEGSCAYLDPRGACSLHALAGPGAKPSGCRRFPLTAFDDGEQVRVSVRLECACVMASSRRSDGAPLVPADTSVYADLGFEADVVPDPVHVTYGLVAPRSEIVAWSKVASSAIERSTDAASVAWTLASTLEREGVSTDAVRRHLLDRVPEPPAPTVVVPWLAALVLRIHGALESEQHWRSAADRCRKGLRVVLGAARRLMDPEALEAALAPSAAHPDEQFYLRAAVFGHHLTVGTLAVSLRDRAVRVVIARALVPLLLKDGATADAAHPLALVDQMIRGAGLGSYPSQVVEQRETASSSAD